MSVIASVEAVPATALGAPSCAVDDDSPSFFDALTAAGVNPPTIPTERCADSPLADVCTSPEEDFLSPATPSNVPNPKNKNAPDAVTVHPFLPGAITPTAILELTPREPAAANFDVGSIDSAISRDAVTSPTGGASPNAPPAPSPSLPSIPAQDFPVPVIPQSDLPVAASPRDVPPTDSHVDIRSSNCNGTSTQSPLSASIRTPLVRPGFDPPQELTRPSAPGSEELLAAKRDLPSEFEQTNAESGRSSCGSGAESRGITISTIAEPLPPEPRNECAQLHDLQISTAPAAPSTENASTPQDAAGSSMSAAGAPIPQKRSPIRTAPPQALFVKAQPQDSEENPPAIRLASDATAEPVSMHSRNAQPTPSSHPYDFESQAAVAAVPAKPSRQTLPGNTKQDPGITPTAQHIPVPPTFSASDSSIGAPADADDLSHNTGSSDHKTTAAAVVPLIVAPALAAHGASSIAAANPQPPSFAPADPHAQVPAPGDSALHAPSLPESFQTPAPTPVHLAQIVSKATQSEMRIGLTTPAFGSVELRAVVHANEVAVQIGSERGDLKTLLTTELPAITHTLQQHDLRLNQIRFEQQGFAFSSDTSQYRDAQPRFFASRTISNPPLERPAFESSPIPELELRRSRGLSILA